MGFSEANVEAYLENPTIVVSEVAKEVKAFIKQHPFVRELVNIPIQLDALCYSWDEISDDSQSASTMRSLYEAMVHKLWRKDIVRLDKSIGNEALTEEWVQRVPFRHLEPHINAESSCLGLLALNGLHKNQLEFKPKDLEEVVKQLEKDHAALPLELETHMTKLSCLQVEKQTQSLQRLSYHFLHLSFQEFFAAQWLVECLRENKPLSLVQFPEMKADGFIRKHQYNPRYELVWWLMAGLLSESEKELQGFFSMLNQGPQDLIGIQHQHLMLHCLRESNGKLPKEEQVQLKSDLYAWLTFEVEQDNGSYPISSLGPQAAFPEVLLLKRLQEGEPLSHRKYMMLFTLLNRPTLSDTTIRGLIRLLKDKDEYVRESAHVVLGEQSLSSEAVASLIELLKHKDAHVKKSAAQALSQQPSLSSEAVTSLIELLKHKDAHVKKSTAQALSQQSSLSSKAVASLIELLKHKDAHVKKSAAQALSRQSSLCLEAIQTLIRLLKNEDRNMRYLAKQALGQQSNISLEALQSLIELCQDKEGEVRLSAVQALGSQSSLSSEAVGGLMGLFKDKERYVGFAAAQALGNQSSLLPEAVASLIKLFKDKNRHVRNCAVKALDQQSKLSHEIIESLSRLCQDERQYVRTVAAQTLGKQLGLSSEAMASLIGLCQDEDGAVRCSAAEALGNQSILPPKVTESLNRLCQDEAEYVRDAAAQALGKQPRLPPEAVTSLIELCQDEDGAVRCSAAETLGNQSILSPKIMESLSRLCQDEEEYVRAAAAQALGKHPRLLPGAVTSLIELFKDEDEEVRDWAADAVGNQSNLAPKVIESLLKLCEDEEGNMRASATHALEKQPAWRGYQTLSTANPSLIKVLYRHWLIPSNLKQVNPLYIEGNSLCFYTSEGIEMIDLNEQEADFRQAILAAQQAIGIPKVSQIKAKNTTSFQANRSHYTFFARPQEDYPMPGSWIEDQQP